MYSISVQFLLVIFNIIKGDILTHVLTSNVFSIENSTPISNVIFQIIFKYETPWENTVDILTESNSQTSSFIQSEIITNILNSGNYSKVFRFDDPGNCSTVQRRTYNIFIVDGYESFLNIYNQMTERCFSYKGFYIIAITELIPNDSNTIEKICQKLWKISVANVMIIVESSRNDSFNIYTYFPFGKRYCRKAVPTLYNVFESGRFMWKVPFFPKKFQNFHGCALKVVTWKFMPYMTLTYLENGTIYPDGIDGTILRVLSQKLNFSRIIVSPGDEQRGEIFSNGTSTGAMHMVIEGDCDFTICGYGFSHQRAIHMSSSIIYLSTDMVFASPVPKSYSSFERLFLPFRSYVWMSIATSFIMGFLITTVLKLCGTKYIEFVSGQQNRSSTYYMLNIFLGGGVTISPRRNFARTMLILWITITIILRSSYQSSMFKFLQSGRINRVDKTAEELIEDGYKIYLFSHHSFLVGLLKLKKGQYVKMDTDASKYYEMLYRPGFKGLLVDTEFDIMYQNAVNREKPIIKPLPERLFHFPTSMFFKKNSYLTDSVDRILEKFMGSGLIFKWASEILSGAYRQIVAKSTPKSITMKDLIGCFQICGLLQALSVLVFVLEIIARKFYVLKTIIDFYTY